MIKFVYQNKPLGTGDAVLKTKKLIKDKFFLMLLPDDLIIKRNCSKDMILVHKKYNCSVMASMNVKRNTVKRWGIYSKEKKINKNNFFIKDVVEKPEIKYAPSNSAVIGRYNAYNSAIISQDNEKLKDALKNNIYRSSEINIKKIDKLIKYIWLQYNHLKIISYNNFFIHTKLFINN